MSYYQPALGVNWEGIEIMEGGSLGVRTRLQADMTSFANDWMRNIRQQQGLKA